MPSFRGITIGSYAERNAKVEIAKPPRVQSGDVMLASIYLESAKATITPPAGWTLVGEKVEQTHGNVFVYATYWKKYEGEAGPYTFTWTGTHGNNYRLVAYQGVNGTTPINATGIATTPAQEAKVKAPSITTTVPNCLLLYVGAENTGVEQSARPEGFMVRSDQGGLTADAEQAEAGATGAKEWTLASAGSAGVGQLIALEPASVNEGKSPAVRLEQQTAFTTGTSESVPKPAGMAVGDLMLMLMWVEASGITIASTGWTVLEQIETGHGFTVAIMWKKYEGEAGAYSVTWGGASHGHTSLLAVIGRTSSTSPVNAHAGATSSTSTTTDRGPSITTTVANTRLILMGSNESGAPTTALPANFNDRRTTNYCLADAFQETAEATGNKDATIESAHWNTGHLIALAPLSGAAAPTNLLDMVV
jgi:hypothetical protein